MSHNHFSVILVGLHNRWLNDCVESVLSQNFPCFTVYITIDPYPRTDGIPMDFRFNPRGHRVEMILNSVRRYQLINRDLWIRDPCIPPDDIIVLGDLDDRFYDTTILSKLNDVYEQYSPWLTYGGMVKEFDKGCKGPFDHSWEEEIPLDDSRTCRQNTGRKDLHHLLTFRKWLYEKIDPDDFKDENGNVFNSCTDRAIQYPMVEMAGIKNLYHTKFPMYIYNNENPENDWRVCKELQEKNSLYIRSKNPYPELS